MNEAFDVTKPDLLEMVLNNLKNDTKNFTARAKVKTDTTFALLKAELQTLFSGEDIFENKIAIEDIIYQLEKINYEKIKATLLIKAAFNLLDNEKPTKAFLNMENSKGGYSEITKLNIPNPQFNKELPESLDNIKQFPITIGKLIREVARHSFQKIFDHQDNLTTDEEDIVGFLNSDGDTLPMETLAKRKLSRAEAGIYGTGYAELPVFV